MTWRPGRDRQRRRGMSQLMEPEVRHDQPIGHDGEAEWDESRVPHPLPERRRPRPPGEHEPGARGLKSSSPAPLMRAQDFNEMRPVYLGRETIGIISSVAEVTALSCNASWPNRLIESDE